MGIYFGKNIKEIRKKNKLTQLEFAKIFGYKDKSMIAHIENGDSEMSNDKIALLIERFGIDASELFVRRKSEEVNRPIICSIPELEKLLIKIEEEQANGEKYYSIDELDLTLRKILGKNPWKWVI